jgi:hypothetical protein
VSHTKITPDGGKNSGLTELSLTSSTTMNEKPVKMWKLLSSEAVGRGFFYLMMLAFLAWMVFRQA